MRFFDHFGHMAHGHALGAWIAVAVGVGVALALGMVAAFRSGNDTGSSES